jgi:hypothetical protein
MGFCYLEQDQLSRARQMLERAALLRPPTPRCRRRCACSARARSRDAAGTAPAPTIRGHRRLARPSSRRSPGWTAGCGTSGGGEIGAADAAPPSTAPGRPLLHRLRPPRRMRSPGCRRPDRAVRRAAVRRAAAGRAAGRCAGARAGGRLTEAVAGDAAARRRAGRRDRRGARTATPLRSAWRGILLEAEHALLHLAPLGRGGRRAGGAAQARRPAGCCGRRRRRRNGPPLPGGVR